jgi:hypothetical protein
MMLLEVRFSIKVHIVKVAYFWMSALLLLLRMANGDWLEKNVTLTPISHLGEL